MKKLMSDLLLAASEDKNLRPDRSHYIEKGYGYIQVCALGAMMTKAGPKKIVKEFLDISHPRNEIIEEICKGTKNACEPLPDNILKKYPRFSEACTYGRKKTWLDLVEYLFQIKCYSFIHIANILRKYDN